MSETTYLKELVVVEDGIAYKFKGVSLSNSNASTILDDLISEYAEKYNNLNTQVTALENQLELGQVKFVTDMTTLNTEQLVNTLYVNDEVVGIVDDGSGIIPQVYLRDGSSVSLKEVERKEEDADDGAEYLGYVNIPNYIEGKFTFEGRDSTSVAISNKRTFGFDINGNETSSPKGTCTISGVRAFYYDINKDDPNTVIAVGFYTDNAPPFSSWIGSKLKFTNITKNTFVTTTGILEEDSEKTLRYWATSENSKYNDEAVLNNWLNIMNENWEDSTESFSFKIEKVS